MSGPGSPPAAGWYRRHLGDIRVAIRAVLAAGLSFAAATLFGLPQPYWSVIAALLVIQATVGASLIASIDWMIGTVGGAIFGSVAGALIPHGDALSTGLALIVVLAPLALLAALNSRYRIAPITAVIALIVPRSPDIGPVQFTLERTAEIGIGALIAVAVSLLVLPSRSHGLLAEAAGRVLRAVAGLVPTLLTDTGRPGDARPLTVFADLTAKMDALGAAAIEARRERRIRVTDDPDPDLLVLGVARIRNDSVMLFRATVRPLAAAVYQRLAEPAAALSAAAADAMRGIAGAFEARQVPPSLDPFERAVAAYRAAVEAMRRDAITRGLAADDIEQLFALNYAYDLLAGDLRELRDCCAAYAPAARRERG